MCGIFGIITSKKQIGNLSYKKALNELFLLSESRGKEASGFASVESAHIDVFKNPFPASQMIKTSFYNDHFDRYSKRELNKFVTIGHSRLVTDGYEHENRNNQPVVKDSLVVVHNGIVVNHAKIWKELDLGPRETDLDTEVIPALLHKESRVGGSVPFAFKKLFEQVYGMTSVAILSAQSDDLYLATNNGSLYYHFNESEQIFIFASEFYIIEQLLSKSRTPFTAMDIVQIQPHTLVVFNHNSFAISTHVLYQIVISDSSELQTKKLDIVLLED
jgi:glucosamine 6-phosphate synthetase-like amidotransferase/phosphosugar isomerase protein